ncbi:hypothetical protein ABZ354_11210 [Streptomyces sp. NPDC005925]|uniref:hypothetical protein n=1 Tax=Streptomyces sp. NPDC005925 TaxID=3157172 RepID=UPI003409E06F
MSMHVRRTVMGASAGLAMVLTVLATGSASAAGEGEDARPVLTAQVVDTEAKGPEGRPHIEITMEKTGVRGEAAFLACNVYLPLVVSDYTMRSMEWQAGTTCNMPVVMEGSTRVYHWGGGTIGYGSTYNTWPGAALAGSEGTLYGVMDGTYGVDHDVTVDIPAGATTNVLAGCQYVNNNQSVRCKTTTGPIYYNS